MKECEEPQSSKAETTWDCWLNKINCTFDFNSAVGEFVAELDSNVDF